MIRNLIYSIFLHLIILLAILPNYIPSSNETQKIVKIQKAFGKKYKYHTCTITDNFMKDIEKNLTESKFIKNKKLNMKEKLTLFKKIKKEEQNKLRNKLTENTIDQTEKLQNKFHYLNTPKYINKNKLTKKEIEIVKKDNAIKQKIRKIIKEYNKDKIINKTQDNNTYTTEELISIAQKPVLLEGTNNKIARISNIEQVDYLLIDTLIPDLKLEDEELDDHSNDVEIPTEIIESTKLNEIFTKKDFKILTKGHEIRRKIRSYRLTPKEEANIKRQMNTCYKVAILRNKKNSKGSVNISFDVDKEGYINLNRLMIPEYKESEEFNEKEYNNTIENIKTALVFCNPLKNLPISKYAMWQRMTFTFDAQEINK